MKKLLSILLAVTLIITAMPLGAFEFKASAATSGTTGACTWTLDGTVLTISGNGDMGNYNNYGTSAPWDRGLTKVIIKDGVTSIGDYAFYYCYSLTSITIPNSVISIGDFAFYNCSSLSSITIPNSVRSIGNVTFYNTGYYNNTRNWEDNVLYIGNNLIKVKESISGSYEIKPGTITVAGGAFYDCTKLTSINIPNSVISIGDQTFYNCSSLININIPNSVTIMDDHAFSCCSSLTSITIPNSVTGIGNRAFYDCRSLTSITISNSVTRIGNEAFWFCSRLTNVYYRGSSDDKSKISIGSGNTYLTDATWYYNSCIGSLDHIYDNSSDNECNICGYKNFVLGDIDGTGKVDLSDVTDFANYLAGWDVNCNESALDVNVDGAVNLKDVVLLAQFVAGWDVVLS